MPATMRTTLGEACFTEVMTELTGSGRSGRDTGEAADGRSDVPMNLVMEIVTAVTSLTSHRGDWGGRHT
jgi:hypothetical protein